MPVSLRIPPEKEQLLRRAAAKAGKSKTAFILEAIDERLGLGANREKRIRETAGWLSHEEAEQLRSTLKVFDEIHPGDWD